MICPNCKNTYSCGCQKRVINGITGCSRCLGDKVQAKVTPQKPQIVVNKALWHK